MPDPVIAFCITNKGRTQHLEQTLPANILDNSGYPNVKFVVLNYNSQDHMLAYLRDNHQDLIRSGKLTAYSLTDETAFKMGHAKNVAHRLGILEGADILVNLDADNFTGKDFANYVADKFENNDRVFLRSVWPFGRDVSKETSFNVLRGCSGRIAVTKQAFLISGGYDEKYDTWGPDDKDFTARLQRLGYIPCEIEGRYLKSVPHRDKMRFREYPQVMTAVGEDSFELENNTTTISNYGKVGCGIVFKNFDFSDPIELAPVPTRIFGIGMHKTGTTSLHHALEILGLDSAHWTGPWWAKAIWREMQDTARSRTLEEHYALCDLPITLLYKDLDDSYPGSKFILTVRDEEKWIRSVKNHWDPRYNEWRDTWDEDCFTHRVHQLLYGRKQFDREIMLGRYRRHNQEVLEYFKDRHEDLLVMNVDQGQGWKELCRFLREPTPQEPYPHSNSDPRTTSGHFGGSGI